MKTVATALSPVDDEAEAQCDLDSEAPPLLDFESIYQNEVTYVWNCLRRLGVQPKDLEDKVQDVFVVLYRRMGDVDPSRSIRAFLSGIAFNVASDYRRKAYGYREQCRDVVEATCDRRSPEAECISREARTLVMAGLDALDMERRAIFVLHEFEGHSIPEISEALHLPLNTCYSKLRLARELFTETIHKLQRGDR